MNETPEPDPGRPAPESPPAAGAAKPAPPAKRRWPRRLRRLAQFLLTVFVVTLLIGWWNVLRIVEHDHWPPPPDAVTAEQAQAFTERFVRQSGLKRDDVAIDYAPTTASSVEVFNGGAAFLPALLRDIESAQESIHFMMFVIVPGDWGMRYADALIARARAGVEVRLSVDRFGSKVYDRSEAMFEEMADAGIEIVVNDIFPLQSDGTFDHDSHTFSQDEVGRADHRKMLVVDGRIGWVGGGGIEDHYATDGFHDVFVRVQGDIVRQMQAVFLTSFRAYGGPVPGEGGGLGRYFPPPADPGTIRVTLLQNIPGGFLPGTQASRAAIEQARQRIDILNPYLTDSGMIDRIVEAAERGVHVRLLVPAESNNAPGDAALKHHYPRLQEAGVEIWEYPTVMHEKLTVADDIAIVGTINYDAWGLYRNLEIALMFEDAPVAAALRQQSVEPDLALAQPGEPATETVEKIEGWFWSKFTYFL
jgi:cardiolipin synthase